MAEGQSAGEKSFATSSDQRGRSDPEHAISHHAIPVPIHPNPSQAISAQLVQDQIMPIHPISIQASPDQTPPGLTNWWEEEALKYNSSDDSSDDGSQHCQREDPLIYPGLYSLSDTNIMDILIRVYCRPEPHFDLGPVDCSVSLILCDLLQPDIPIVYISGAFTALTGYAVPEIYGRNCRVLQAPGGNVHRGGPRGPDVESGAIHQMRHAVERNSEIQLNVANYRKDGSQFHNCLTIIPLRWDSGEFRYSVGFMATF